MKVLFENGETASYPLLVDCPCFILQGGGAFIEMPIQKGDECIILFNDRDIDNWFNGTTKEPNSNRKHTLSDGIAIVGINNKTKTLELDGEIVKIITNDYPFTIDAGSKDITIKTTGNINIEDAATIKMLQGTEDMVKGTTLKNMFTTLCSAISAATSGTTPQNAAGITTIKEAFSAFNGQLLNMNSSKITVE